MSFSTKCHGAIDWEFSDSLPRLTFNNITCFIALPPVQLWASLSSRSDNL